MTAPSLKDLMNKVAAGSTLGREEIVSALDLLMTDDATATQRAAFLMALRVRGETIDEITGAADVLRQRMTPISVPSGAVDIVGTGGDSHGTYNVSTCATFVAAGAGLKVAKHGNRSVSSKSGASDVLAALGVKLDVPLETVAGAVKDIGVGFMWAPMHHPAMKHWGPIRADLGIRTIFNLLGPLANPANVKRQVIGVFDKAWVEPIAVALQKLGSDHAWVVHGSDGMDELTTTGPSFVAELKDGNIQTFEISPEEAGLERASLADLKGGDATVNAAAIRDVLSGTQNAFRDIVVWNTCAALIVGGKAASVAEGVAQAQAAIDSGAAKAALDALVDYTNKGA